ncbi:MAG: hypothetical protein HKM92_08775 [Arenibacter sp.]|nr:hypothetical protein [Arenibacter sp.]
MNDVVTFAIPTQIHGQFAQIAMVVLGFRIASTMAIIFTNKFPPIDTEIS